SGRRDPRVRGRAHRLAGNPAGSDRQGRAGKLPAVADQQLSSCINENGSRSAPVFVTARPPQYTSCWVLCTLNLPVGVISRGSRMTRLSSRVLSATTTMSDSSSCPLHTENHTSSPARLYSGWTIRRGPSAIPDHSAIGSTL